MNRKLLLLAAASTLAIAACKPQAPAEPAAPAAPVEQAAAPVEPAPAAMESAPASSAAEVPFDVKGFAGTFSGGGTTLALKADGTYTLSGSVDGTWTAEEDGKRIRLDPNSKSEEDRLFAVASNDQLDALGVNGQPAAVAATLRRETPKP
jgi:copper homeostasis protein (lipoprotein)